VIDPAAFQQVTLAKGVAEMGEPMSLAANPSHTYPSNGTFTATLTVRGPQNLTATATVSPTGGWKTFVTVDGGLSAVPSGTIRLYLVFTGGTGALFDVDDFAFTTGAPGRITGINGKCVDVAGDGTPFRIWDCNAGANPRWTFS
jgi:hypothetical protein